MASSLTADKRWASTRKHGMTVLGKIPKPINLPSQRSENNGLDPNVEIIPRGTLTWGTKSVSSPTNAWSSSTTLSPKNDGAASSPSHNNARPSSGCGMRPSTAGSDKSLDSASAWSSNSRPSTASGLLPSHHSASSSRPRSADMRPGSSQLSRFADSSLENARGTIRTHERLELTNVFSLSSGEFPTLGSERSSETQRGHSSHGRPVSSSGPGSGHDGSGQLEKALLTRGSDSVTAFNSQNVNVLKSDCAYDGSGHQPVPTDQRDIHHPAAYPNFPVGPHQFNPWPAPPLLPPDGIHHGPPGPAYRPFRPGPTGSVPVEIFAHYPHYPHSEHAARPATGPGGYNSKNGEGFHSHMPYNAYAMNPPIIPVRPVYPAPVHYEGHGYYGPRPSFPNAADEISYRPVPPHTGAPIQYPGQLGSQHSQSNIDEELMHKQHPESDRPKVALRVHRNSSHGSQHRRKEGQEYEADRKALQSDHILSDVQALHLVNAERIVLSGTKSFDTAKVLMLKKDSSGGIVKKDVRDDHVDFVDQQSVNEKNVALIEKIEGLNNKARSMGVPAMADTSMPGEARKGHLMSNEVNQAILADGPRVTGKAIQDNLATESVVVSVPLKPQITDTAASKKLEASHSHSHKRANTSKNRHDGLTKERAAILGDIGLKSQLDSDNPTQVEVSKYQDSQVSKNTKQDSSNVASADDAHSSPPDLLDDENTQRAKMKQMAKQRSKQLKEEEEERTRQQKAKALAKLEELNRRSSEHSQAMGNAVQPPLADDAQYKQEPGLPAVIKFGTITPEPTVVTSGVNSVFPAQTHVIGGSHNLKSTGEEFQKQFSVKIPMNVIQSGVQKQREEFRKGGQISVVEGDKISGDKTATIEALENSNITMSSNLDVPAQSRKSERRLRNKKKLQDAPLSSAAALSPNQHVDRSADGHDELQTKTNLAITDGSRTSVATNKSITRELVQPHDEAHRPRPQHPRRSTKHSARPSEKLNETAVWAPVKQTSKVDPQLPEESGLNSPVVANVDAALKKNRELDSVGRTKRAELEIYIPKPLLKEQHQNSAQHSKNTLSDNVSGSTDAVGKAIEKELPDPSTIATQTEPVVDPNKWDERRTNRYGRVNASWRKRNTLQEPTAAFPNSTEFSNEADLGEIGSETFHHGQRQKLEGPTLAEHSVSAALVHTIVKDEEIAERHGVVVTKPRFVGRSGGAKLNDNFETEKRENVAFDDHQVQPSHATESARTDRRNVFKSEMKNPGVAHPKVQWKPKLPSVTQAGNTSDPDRPSDKKATNIEEQDGGGNLDNSRGQVEDEGLDPQHRAAPPPRNHGAHGRNNRGREMAYRNRGNDAGRQYPSSSSDRRKGGGGTHREYQPVGLHGSANLGDSQLPAGNAHHREAVAQE